MTGWPYPERPGVPLNPERDGWHFLHHPEDLRPVPTPWDAAHQAWCSGGMHSPQGVLDLGYHYLGPCLTPAEVDALRAQIDTLRDPNAVHLNMLRGPIARPSWAQIEHLYPTEVAAQLAAARRAALEEAAGRVRVAAHTQGVRAANARGVRRETIEAAASLLYRLSDEIRALAQKEAGDAV